MGFFRFRRSGGGGRRVRRGRRVSFTVTDAMYEHLRRKGEFFGSMAGYLRYLVMADMEGGFSVRTVRVVERERVAEVSGVAVASRVSPPSAPPSASRVSPPRGSQEGGGRVSVAGSGYGALHAELLAELKQKFKSLNVDSG